MTTSVFFWSNLLLAMYCQFKFHQTDLFGHRKLVYYLWL